MTSDGWTPERSDACALWLRADRGISRDAAQKVTLAADWSGRRHHFTGVVDHRPTVLPAVPNPRDAIDFESTDPDYLTTPDAADLKFTNGQNFTIWMVVKVENNIGKEVLALKSHGSHTLPQNAGSKGFSIVFHGDVSPATLRLRLVDSNFVKYSLIVNTDILGQLFIITWTVDWAGNSQCYLNGVAKESVDISGSTGNIDGDSPLYLGVAADKTLFPLDGWMTDFGIIRKKQGQAERDRIGRYLASRLGLTWP